MGVEQSRCIASQRVFIIVGQFAFFLLALDLAVALFQGKERDFVLSFIQAPRVADCEHKVPSFMSTVMQHTAHVNRHSASCLSRVEGRHGHACDYLQRHEEASLALLSSNRGWARADLQIRRPDRGRGVLPAVNGESLHFEVWD